MSTAAAEKKVVRMVGLYTTLTALAGISLAVWVGYYAPPSLDVPGQRYWPLVLGCGVLLLVAVLGTWRMSQSSSSGQLGRLERRSRRMSGQASAWMIHRTSGARSARKELTTLRPRLAELPWWRRRTVATSEVASKAVRVGPAWVYTRIEEVTGLFAGPRQGKSVLLASRILDAPGAVICTTTRRDLYDNTHELRRKVGPVYVYNPTGIGGLDSTIGFDPLMGCTDGPTAQERAEDLIAGGDTGGGDHGERAFWNGLGALYLGTFLHAAALGRDEHGYGPDMGDVRAWVADPDAAQQAVTKLLIRSPDPTFSANATQFFAMNDKTRSSITSTISPALRWLSTPAAVASTKATTFDVEQIIDGRATVYLLASKKTKAIVPLVTALVSYIARAAVARAGGERLEPPMKFALDEFFVTCPIPLDEWTSDMGGFNIGIDYVTQSASQLRERLGESGAATVLNNTTTLIQYGGSKNFADLEAISKLIGERDELVPTFDKHGKLTSKQVHKVPVIPPAQLAQLGKHRAVVIRTGMLPALGRTRRFWTRADVRWHNACKAATAAKTAINNAAAWAATKLTGIRVRAEATLTERRQAHSWATHPHQATGQPDIQTGRLDNSPQSPPRLSLIHNADRDNRDTDHPGPAAADRPDHEQRGDEEEPA